MTTPAPRRNEVPNPSAANDVAGWLGAGTRSRVSGQTGAAPRPTAAEVTIPTSAWAVSLGCPGVPAQAGQTWSGVGWIWSTVDYTFQVGFVGWTGDTYRTDPGPPVQVPVTANTWTEVRLPPTTLSAGGSTWELINFQLNMPAGGSGTGVARLTGCRLEQVSDPAIAYADGDTPGWTWDGTAGSSSSTFVGDTDPEPEPEPEPSSAEVGTSGRVFTRGGRRFFWLADTAWAIFRRTEGQIDQYLSARRAQRFTAIHGVMMNPQAGGPTNAYGVSPYSGGTISNRNDAYWDHVDYFVDACAEYGLVAALHPMWADGQAGSVVTASNAFGYGQFLGNRYKDYSHITWTFGGDYPPTGQTQMWANLADGIRAAGDTHIITYHPQGDQTSAQFFTGTPWLDFHAMQGGHCINYSVDRSLVAQTHAAGLPWIDAEPIYEQHPYCWEPSRGYATALDCRRDAYWRILGGAAGHTYGHHSVWQFYTGSGGTSNPIDTWTTALGAEGAEDMRHVRALFESRPRLEPDNARVTNPGTDAGWTPAASDATGTTLVVYSAQGASRTVVKTGLVGTTARPWWFDPRTGATTQLADTSTSGSQTFTPPSSNTDWVLVLDAVNADYPAPGTTVHDDGGEEEPEPEPGPQPGDVLGTNATLTWTPTVPGTYTVRYSATNSAGTGTDDITVTVLPAVEPGRALLAT